jgi:CBS domain-containing protein
MLEQKFTARDIMTSPVYTVYPTDRVRRVIALLCTHRISGVPVIDRKGHLVGLISERDLLEAMYPKRQELRQDRDDDPSRSVARVSSFQNLRVKDIMARHVVTAPPDADPLRLASTMALRKIRRIPIVEGKKLVGIVSQGDVYRSIFQTGPSAADPPGERRPPRRIEA